MATPQKHHWKFVTTKLDVTVAQIVKRDKAFANPDIAIRRVRHKGDGIWHEVIARGDGKQTALLAGFRSEKDAARCKRSLIEALNAILVPLLLKAKPAKRARPRPA